MLNAVNDTVPFKENINNTELNGHKCFIEGSFAYVDG